jgi:hypothetical protein
MPKITGSINMLQTIKHRIKVSFSEAASTVQKEISGRTVVAGHLEVVQGYLVYTFIVVDSTNQNIHMVIVDPGNGHVRHTTPAHLINSFDEHLGFSEEHRWMMHGFGEGMWKHYNNNNIPEGQMTAPNNCTGI